MHSSLPNQTWLLFGCFVSLFFTAFNISALELELVNDKTPVNVFGGGVRKIQLKWHNPGLQAVDVPIKIQVVQASSSTAAALLTAPWKTLRVLAQQTILESAELQLPVVRGKTRF